MRRTAMAVSLLMTSLILATGNTWARCEQTSSVQVELALQKIRQPRLLSCETKEEDGIRILNFQLANGKNEEDYSTSDQEVVLRLFVTAGVEDPDNLRIRLLDGEDNSYKATEEEVISGSTIDAMYGSGWMYCFYNKAGEEITWTLLGEKFTAKDLSLTIEGSGGFPAAVYLLAAPLQNGKADMAHLDSFDVWSGQIEANEESSWNSRLKSNLLTADGQTVLFENYQEKYEIPITLEGEASDTEEDQFEVTIEEGKESLLKADLSEMQTDEDGGRYLVLTMDFTEDDSEDDEEKEDEEEKEEKNDDEKEDNSKKENTKEETNKEEEKNDDEIEEQEEDDGETENSVKDIEEKVEQEVVKPEAKAEKSEAASEDEDPKKKDPKDEDPKETTGETLKGDSDKNTEKDPDKDSDSKTDENSDEDIEEDPKSVTVTLTWSRGEESCLADFVVPLAADWLDKKKEATGTLDSYPTKYSENFPIMVTAGEEAVWLEEYEEEEAVSFPAMTKYTIDEKTTVLYDGGGIAIPAKTTVDIELPAKEEDTDSGSDSITLKAGEETYVLQKAKDVIVDTSEQPYLVSTKAITLPISLAKEEDEKLDYTLQRLVRNENDDHLVWQKVPDGVIQINKTDSGAMQLAAENARAGTYQIWIPGYQAAIPFFVQYENASQGGSGQ